MTPREEKLILTNSIERIINMTITILEETDHRWIDVNLDDWNKIKSTIVHLWNGKVEEILRKRAER